MRAWRIVAITISVAVLWPCTAAIGIDRAMFDRALSSLLERGLAESPRAAALTRALAGRRLAVKIDGTPWIIIVESTGTTLQLTRGDTRGVDGSGRADATVSGGPISLLALAGEHAQQVIQRGDVRIDGDVDAAQQYRELALL